MIKPWVQFLIFENFRFIIPVIFWFPLQSSRCRYKREWHKRGCSRPQKVSIRQNYSIANLQCNKKIVSSWEKSLKKYQICQKGIIFWVNFFFKASFHLNLSNSSIFKCCSFCPYFLIFCQFLSTFSILSLSILSNFVKLYFVQGFFCQLLSTFVQLFNYVQSFKFA